MSRDLTIAARAAAALLFGGSLHGNPGGHPYRQDMLWLDRVTYGPTSAVVDQYLELGRKRFLEQQLNPTDVRRPEGSDGENVPDVIGPNNSRG